MQVEGAGARAGDVAGVAGHALEQFLGLQFGDQGLADGDQGYRMPVVGPLGAPMLLESSVSM